MRIRIDGEVKTIDVQRSGFYVMGPDLNGRICRTAFHSFRNVTAVLEHIKAGGAVRSTGHRYTKA